MKKLLQQFYSTRVYNLYDPYQKKLINVKYYKLFGIVFKTIDVPTNFINLRKN